MPRLGITLNQHPRLMLDGREMLGQSDRTGVSSLGWAGIGVGALAIVAGGFAIYVANHDEKD